MSMTINKHSRSPTREKKNFEKISIRSQVKPCSTLFTQFMFFPCVSKAFSLLVCLVRLIYRFKHDWRIKKKKKFGKISDTQKVIALT